MSEKTQNVKKATKATNKSKDSKQTTKKKPTKKQLPKAIDNIVVYKKWCKKCGICVAFCPMKCLGFDEEGYPTPLDKECSRCGLCDFRCPDFAITGLKNW